MESALWKGSGELERSAEKGLGGGALDEVDGQDQVLVTIRGRLGHQLIDKFNGADAGFLLTRTIPATEKGRH